MNNSKIFAVRLNNSRMINGYSMDELVDAMGNEVSKMAISKYEKAQLFPNSSVLVFLAKALNQSVDYFFRPFMLSVDTVKFRKKKKRAFFCEAGKMHPRERRRFIYKNDTSTLKISAMPP